MTLASDFEAVADGPILFAVLGFDEDVHQPGPTPKFNGKVVAWSVARYTLDYEYDAGLGLKDCHPTYAWTLHRVLFVHEYDGATHVHWVPRHPVNVDPEFGGAG